jgi:DNA-binding NarL/FixJ family response regulator
MSSEIGRSETMPRDAADAPVTVMVVEDEEKILRSQLALLQGFEEIQVVGQATSGTDAVQRIEALKPDVVLLDLGLPGIDGIEVTRRVKAALPRTEILIFTIFDEEEKVLSAIGAGASGYLLKGMEADRIVQAILEVHQGGSVVQPQLARRLLRHFQRQPVKESAETRLSPRETEILRLISKGLSNPQVAQALGVSRATVRTHLEHIYTKLDVSNRTEAVTEGIKKGLIDL